MKYEPNCMGLNKQTYFYIIIITLCPVHKMHSFVNHPLRLQDIMLKIYIISMTLQHPSASRVMSGPTIYCTVLYCREYY